jgi:hypothetical protein
MAWAMFCSITVLPAFGGATIRPRWPLPIGAIMSMTRLVMFSSLPMSRSSSSVLGRVQRRQVLEQDLVLGGLRRLAIDAVDLDQGEVALAFLGRADLAFDGVAGAQVEAADLARADVDVVGAGEVGLSGARRKPKPSGRISSTPSLAFSMLLAAAISSSWLT